MTRRGQVSELSTRRAQKRTKKNTRESIRVILPKNDPKPNESDDKEKPCRSCQIHLITYNKIAFLST